MDLRKKASPVQILGESLLRFRLIFLVIFAVLYVIFARDFSSTFAYILGAGESLAQTIASWTDKGVAEADYPFLIAVGALVVVLFVMRLWLGKIRNALSFLFSTLFISALALALNEVEETVAYVFLGFLLLSMILFFVVRVASFKALLPVLLASFFWISISAVVAIPFFVGVSFVVLALADMLAVSLDTGAELKKGTPVSGSLVSSFCKAFLPSVISTVLLGGLNGYFYHSCIPIWMAIVFPVISLALFLLVEFPVMSFAPMSKMRAAHRSMKV